MGSSVHRSWNGIGRNFLVERFDRPREKRASQFVPSRCSRSPSCSCGISA